MEVGNLIYQINGYQFIKGQLIIFFKPAKRMRLLDSLCKYDCSDDHVIFFRFIAVKRITPRGIIFSPSPHEHNPAMVLQLPFVSLHLLFTKIKASKNYT